MGGKTITKCNQAKHWDFPEAGKKKKSQTISTVAYMKDELHTLHGPLQVTTACCLITATDAYNS